MRSKLKNYVSGSVLEKTFRAGETLQAAQIEKRDSQFTYVDGEDVSYLAPSKLQRALRCTTLVIGLLFFIHSSLAY